MASKSRKTSFTSNSLGSTSGNQPTTLLSNITDFAVKAASTTANITKQSVEKATGIVTSTADALGLKDNVEAAENMARKLAARGKMETNKAMNKARRMANRAFEFDEEDLINSYDYDVLLASAGAVEKVVYNNLPVILNVPAGNSLVYKARVKKYDINFSIKETRENETIVNVLETPQKYTPDLQIKGMISSVDYSRTITLFFDNSHSPLQRKNVAYWIVIGENVSLADDQQASGKSKEMTAAEEGPPE